MDKLYYNSKSADKPAGLGVNEDVSDPSIYAELNKIKNWRKILSNFYESEFIYDGKTYNSAEHAFQGKKIELANPEKAYWFSKDSGHEIGSFHGSIAQKNRKLVVLTKAQLEVWDTIKYGIMEDILSAKFRQVAIAKRVLLLTGNAILLHGTRGVHIRRQFDLEKVRESLTQ